MAAVIVAVVAVNAKRVQEQADFLEAAFAPISEALR
jgi:hypothetical protein